MKLAKRIGYKLIVAICIIVTFCTFIASTPVEASKVNKTDFYYSGTQKGSYTVNKDFFDILAETLGAILDYLLGLCTMGLRMVFVGWTALFERALTWIFEGATGENVEIEKVSSTNLIGSDEWITIDAIFFNHVPLLDINFFDFEGITEYDAIGSKIEGEEDNHEAPMIIYTEEITDGEMIGTVTTTAVQGEKVDFKADNGEGEKKSLIIVLKETIAGWYYTLRSISLMVMLVLLMYIGIQLAIKSSATDKAVYKKMLTDWVVGMILVFSIHYIILFIISLNEVGVEAIEKLRTGATPLAQYEYGLKERAQRPLTNEELEYTLYDEVKTRAYDVKMSVGTTGMIMYMTLVYYAWKFSFIYLKRYLTVAVLVIMAPLIAVSYAYNKVTSGKATIFSKWFKEFFFIVMLQTIHALIYVTFVQTALGISLNSIAGIILVFVLFNFMSKAEEMFRKIFRIQGALTNDIAKGQGIRATMQGLKNAMGTMAVGKLAKNYTKGVAKLITKPARSLATYGFGEAMKSRAKKLNEQAKLYGEEHHNGVKDYTDLRRALRNKRTNALTYGKLLKQLDNSEIDLEELEEEIDALKEGDALYDENNTFIGLVDKEYIDSKRAELNQLKTMLNLEDREKQELIQEFDRLHDKNGNLKKLRIFMGDKWNDIMDPTRYTKEIKDREGKVIGYEKIKKERELGEVHFKHFTMKFGKVTDSVGKRLSNQLTWSNLTGMNKEEQKAIQEQVNFIRNRITGFVGIVGGLTLAVAEPAIGMGMLATGMSAYSSQLSGDGKKRERVLSLYTMDSAGKYTFNRFEGKSEHTIAEGAKVMARAQVQDIVNAKLQQEASMKARMEAKHPKLAKALKMSKTGGKVAQFATVSTLGMLGGAPAIVAGVGAAAGVKLTGSILSRMNDNAWSRYQASVRAAAKANGKAFEKDQKSAGTADYLNIFANQYFELEHQEYKRDAERHAEKFGEEYALILTAMQTKIDEKTDAEILRDSAYEEEIVVERTEDGRPQISVEAENKLIDDALIIYAQTSGLMDVTQINVEDKKDQLSNILKTELITRGIIARDEEIDVIFEDVTKQLKERQDKFKDENRGQEAVESKIAGDAILSIMREKGLTDPSQVSDDEALLRFNTEYSASMANMAQSAQQTDQVLENLVSQKGDGSQSPRIDELEERTTRATMVIKARKTSFADKAKQPIDEAMSKAMRDTLKKKNELELDKKILSAEDQLKTGQAENVGDILFNESGGFDSTSDGSIEITSSDDIIKMLQIQTQLHKDKDKMAVAAQHRSSGRDEKVRLYQEIKADGSRSSTASASNDGSRRVTTSPIRGGKTQDKKQQMTTEISEILKMKKQELRV